VAEAIGLGGPWSIHFFPHVGHPYAWPTHVWALAVIYDLTCCVKRMSYVTSLHDVCDGLMTQNKVKIVATGGRLQAKNCTKIPRPPLAVREGLACCQRSKTSRCLSPSGLNSRALQACPVLLSFCHLWLDISVSSHSDVMWLVIHESRGIIVWIISMSWLSVKLYLTFSQRICCLIVSTFNSCLVQQLLIQQLLANTVVRNTEIYWAKHSILTNNINDI